MSTSATAANGVFVSGFGSGAGKSTTCHALLQWALRPMPDGGAGYAASDVAYIKPATQCEAITPVAEWCASKGVEAVGVGPVVFQKGFTTTVINSKEFAIENGAESAEVSAEGDSVAAAEPTMTEGKYLKMAADSVREIAARKKFVVVDGVGYPSVGSCIGLGNARLAAALNLPVILIGPPGVGDAIDTFDLMMSYFLTHGVRVFGCLQNKVIDTSRHKIAESTPVVQRWFDIVAKKRFGSAAVDAFAAAAVAAAAAFSATPTLEVKATENDSNNEAESAPLTLLPFESPSQPVQSPDAALALHAVSADDATPAKAMANAAVKRYTDAVDAARAKAERVRARWPVYLGAVPMDEEGRTADPEKAALAAGRALCALDVDAFRDLVLFDDRL